MVEQRRGRSPARAGTATRTVVSQTELPVYWRQVEGAEPPAAAEPEERRRSRASRSRRRPGRRAGSSTGSPRPSGQRADDPVLAASPGRSRCSSRTPCCRTRRSPRSASPGPGPSRGRACSAGTGRRPRRATLFTGRPSSPGPELVADAVIELEEPLVVDQEARRLQEPVAEERPAARVPLVVVEVVEPFLVEEPGRPLRPGEVEERELTAEDRLAERRLGAGPDGQPASGRAAGRRP